jgi:hypothetical protein
MKPQISTIVASVLFAATALAHADVVISTNPTANMSCSSGVCTATASKGVLNVGDLTAMLASGNVTVATGSLAKDIEINAVLSWTSTSRLTLDARQSVTVNRPVTVAGAGAMTITTNDGGTGGDLFFFGKGSVSFWDLSSSLVVNDNSYALVGDIQTLASDIAANEQGFYALANDYDAKGDTFRHSPIILFTGTFEGLGNSIANLRVRQGYEQCEGMFAATGTSATIRDFALKNVKVSSRTRLYVGGLVGCNEATIFSTSVSGIVSGTYKFAEVGGLVGDNGGTIVRSRSLANVSGAYATGGLVGSNGGWIDQSFATGTVTASSGGIGGFAGQNLQTISNSYATGAVTGHPEGAGGFIATTGSLIEEVYSTGLVNVSGALLVGGLVGQDDELTVSTSYWDLDTSEISDPSQGAGDPANDPGITGLTDAQLKAALPAGFSSTIWGQNAKINNGYPYLLANPPQ